MKMYFATKDSEFCYPKEEHLHEETNEVYEAIREKNSDHFFCRAVNQVGTKGEGICGKHCGSYKPRNGKSGICKLNGPVYYHGEKVILR